jgi:hypothetical protein
MTAFKMGPSIQYLRWALPLLLAFAGTASAGPALQPYDNYDLTGPNHRILRGGSLQTCSAACQDEAQCQAFSYDKWEQKCFLKQDLGAFSFDPRFTSGISSRLASPPISNEPIVMMCSAERIVTHSEASSFTASSLGQCQKACEEDSNCVAFTFEQFQQKCSVFPTADEVVDDRAVVSGVKRQLSASTEQRSRASCLAFSRDKIQLEQEIYNAARDDVAKLRSYLATCSVCSMAPFARQQVETIERAHREADERQTYEAARGDEAKLREYVSSCSICSDASAAREGIAWFEQQREQLPADAPGFSSWLNSSQYQQLFDAMVVRNNYPVVVEATTFKGDLLFHARFSPYPKGQFWFYSAHGITAEMFAQRDRLYRTKGYTLIHRQSVELNGEEYIQATWIRQ